MSRQHSIGVENSFRLETSQWTQIRSILFFVALVAWAAAATGFATNRQRFFESWLVGIVFAVTIALGALFFVMIQHLTNSVWSLTVRRVMENIMATLPAAALLFLPVLAGMHGLYPWTHEQDAAIRAKSAFLNQPFFIARAAVYFAIWGFFAWKLRRDSVGRDEGKTTYPAKWSAPGLPLLFITGTLASFDWIMSLDPHWYSTIFGVYVLSGGALAFMAALILTCLALRRAGILDDAIHIEHYHDLGKWLFGLTIFWAYIAFSQYLLIWYANIPEETIWFKHRLQGSWRPFSAVLLFGHFILPFVLLLARAGKRNLSLLAFASVWILVMHLVDVYWMIMPAIHEHGSAVHWLDVAAPAAVLSALTLVFWWRMKSAPVAPVGDPQFDEALEFQNV